MGSDGAALISLLAPTISLTAEWLLVGTGTVRHGLSRLRLTLLSMRAVAASLAVAS